MAMVNTQYCSWLDTIERELSQHADESYRTKIRDYFNTNVDHFTGVKVPVIRQIANQYYRDLKTINIEELFQYCEALLATKGYEQKVIAFHLIYKRKKQFTQAHFTIFEQWLMQHVDDWMDCDDLSTHALGECVILFPDTLPKVEKWITAKNRWLRRASAVSLIPAARKGLYLPQVFSTADQLYQDEDDLVLKGCGWLLKEASKKYQNEVFDYIMMHKEKMSRIVLRYAIEKMDTTKKQQAMI